MIAPIAASSLLLSACTAPSSPAIVIEGAWSPPAPPGATAAAAYLSITARQTDVLISAATDAARFTEMHTTTIDAGFMRMRPLERVTIAAGAAVRFAPGEHHFMLRELRTPHQAGSSFTMRLTFQNAGVVQVHVPIQSAAPQ